MLKLKSSNQRVIWLAIAAALGTVGLSLFAYLNLRAPNPDAAKATTAPASPTPQPSPNVKGVSALGRLQPEGKDLIQVTAPSSGQMAMQYVVQELRVKEGSKVDKGDILAVLDSQDSLQASVIEAEANLRDALARLAQVKAGAKAGDIAAERANVARLEAELQIARREYERNQQLQKDGAISAADLDTRWRTFKTTERQLEQARQTLNSVKEVRPTDVRQAEAQVAIAQAALQRAKSNLDKAYIRAPLAGQVIKIHTFPGEKVGDDGLLDLGNTDNMYVLAEVYETDIRKVKVGQQAVITSPAFEGEVTGKVEVIGLKVQRNDVFSTDPQADTDTRVVEVKIRLDDSQRVASFTNMQVFVAIKP